MGWSGEITVNSPKRTEIIFTPNPESTSNDPVNNLIDPTSYAGTYTVSSFTAPKKAIYCFLLIGAGGATRKNMHDDTAGHGGANGGQGGKTEGYLLLEENETVYIGAGGCCRASFVSKTNGESLAAINKSDLYFVAGAGGNGGGYAESQNFTGFNCKMAEGGKGGGSSGTKTSSPEASYCDSGNAGTQTAGGAAIPAGSSTDPRMRFTGSTEGSYGNGGNGGYTGGGQHRAFGGRGGDGYYGGSGGSSSTCNTTTGSDTGDGACAGGGGGGSGYVKTARFTVGNNAYESTTEQGNGASANQSGSVTVIYYEDAELPILYNNKEVFELYFNDNKVNSLYFNETKIY